MSPNAAGRWAPRARPGPRRRPATGCRPAARGRATRRTGPGPWRGALEGIDARGEPPAPPLHEAQVGDLVVEGGRRRPPVAGHDRRRGERPQPLQGDEGAGHRPSPRTASRRTPGRRRTELVLGQPGDDVVGRAPVREVQLDSRSVYRRSTDPRTSRMAVPPSSPHSTPGNSPDAMCPAAITSSRQRWWPMIVPPAAGSCRGCGRRGGAC
jgi:hypothetical protein